MQLFVYLVRVIDSILGQQFRANSNSSGCRQTSTLDKFLRETGHLLPSVILKWNAWNVSLWSIFTNLGWQVNIMLIPSVVTLKKYFLENYVKLKCIFYDRIYQMNLGPVEDSLKKVFLTHTPTWSFNYADQYLLLQFCSRRPVSFLQSLFRKNV